MFNIISNWENTNRNNELPLHIHQDGYHFKKWEINVGEDIEKLESSCIAPGGMDIWQFLKNLNIELPHDSIVPLLGTDRKELELVLK